MVAGAESKDSPRTAPALNLANPFFLTGYTLAHTKPINGDLVEFRNRTTDTLVSVA